MSTPLPTTLRQLAAGVRALLVLTLVLGLGYPLLMTGAAQLLFPDHADGSLVRARGGTVGSALIGQAFTRPGGSGQPVPDPAYFQGRPSAAGTGYDPLATSASNYGLDNPVLVRLVEQRRAAAARLDGVGPAQVAPDAMLASGSGLDPHISPLYAAEQVSRVARERRLPERQVRDLVRRYTQGRTLGFLGEPRVNVLLLNLALDSLTHTPGRD